VNASLPVDETSPLAAISPWLMPFIAVHYFLLSRLDPTCFKESCHYHQCRNWQRSLLEPEASWLAIAISCHHAEKVRWFTDGCNFFTAFTTGRGTASISAIGHIDNELQGNVSRQPSSFLRMRGLGLLISASKGRAQFTG